MASFVAMVPPSGKGKGSEEALFIHDGYAWGAGWFTAGWFLFHRNFLYACIVGTCILLMAVAAVAYDSYLEATIGLGLLSLWCGLEGNAVRIRTLEAQGWSVAAVVEADDVSGSELLFFADAEIDDAQRSELRNKGQSRSFSHPPSSSEPALGLIDFESNRPS